MNLTPVSALALFVALGMTLPDLWASELAARSEMDADATSREAHRIGVMASAFDPYPALAGVVATYNLSDWAQASLGFGQTGRGTVAFNRNPISTTSFSTGARLLVPGWNFSPAVGAAFSRLGFTGRDTLSGFSADQSAWTINAGFAWQTRFGFAMNIGVAAPLGTTFQNLNAIYAPLKEDAQWLKTLPYLSLGWFI